jgi:hypothetical protein
MTAVHFWNQGFEFRVVDRTGALDWSLDWKVALEPGIGAQDLSRDQCPGVDAEKRSD